MPHITVDGCDTTKNIQRVFLHAEITFSKEYFSSTHSIAKLKELQGKLENLVQEYFPYCESDTHSNHEWNCRVNNK